MEEFLIERLGHHGDGIADGPVYVPLTLPGERVSGLREGDRLSEMRVVQPSEDRVSAPCSHFKACGGCGLQHASDAFVAKWKTEVVRHALEGRGLETEMRPIVTSPAASRRRAVFAARRTKKGAMAGFHRRGSGEVVPVPGCTLLLPEVRAGVEVAEALAVLGTSRKAGLDVTVTASEDGLDISVIGGKEADGQMLVELAALAVRFDLARLTWDGEVVAMQRPPTQRFGAGRVVPPPGAFLQATREGEAALLDAVREAVGNGARGIDLFAGSGTFTLPLAERAEMRAYEGDAAMIRALDQGWRGAEGLKKVEAKSRDLFRNPLIGDELRSDFVVIDPPRAGAEAQTQALAEHGPERIAFVSCNPVTFARDAGVLVGAGYRLDWVQVVDQFRWSAHIELVARFLRG